MDEKAMKVLEAMQGMTYQEWLIISRIVDTHFRIRANQQMNEIVIASPEEVMECKRLL